MQKAIEGAILPPLVISGISLSSFNKLSYRIIKCFVTHRMKATHPVVFVPLKLSAISSNPAGRVVNRLMKFHK